MRVADLPGFGHDWDLNGLDPEWPVEIRMVDVFPVGEMAISDLDATARYEKAYRRYGPWALPPIVSLRDERRRTGDVILTGAHRMYAAHRVGIRRIPELLVHVIVE